jgi:type IV secretion system protein VirB10
MNTKQTNEGNTDFDFSNSIEQAPIDDRLNKNDQDFDDMPDVDVTTNRDNSGTKRLKMLGLAVLALLVVFVAMGIAFNRHQANKEVRKQQEAEEALNSRDSIGATAGRVNIGEDQADLTAQSMYELPIPAGAIDPNAPDGSVAPPMMMQSEPVSIPQSSPVYQAYGDSGGGVTAPPMQTSNSGSMGALSDMGMFDDANSSPNNNSFPATDPAPIPLTPAQLKRQRLLGTGVMAYESAGLQAVSQQGGANGAANGNQSDFAKNFSGTQLAQGSAQRRGDTSLLLAKGTNISCVLKTKIVSDYQGFTTCQISKNIYSANGKVLLIERGSSAFGEQKVEVKQGKARVFVLWTKIETPKGVSVNLDSPATGQLGEMGIGANVNNHFFKRFGSAIMLSLIEDSISVATSRLEDKESNNGNNNTTVQSTSRTTQSIAEKALDSTINIAPTATVPQGTILNILVARDVDFGTVYGYR